MPSFRRREQESFDGQHQRSVKCTSKSVVRIFCPAKINLGLKVSPPRTDLYHEIQSIFLPVSLGDTIKVTENQQFKLSSNCANFPTNESNLIHKVCQAYSRLTQRESLPNYSVFVEKMIPQEAGLGGGSSNAGVLLRWLDQHLKTQLSSEQLITIAKENGADIPFFLNPVPAFLSGIGEKIMPAKKRLPELPVLLVKPSQGLCTKTIFTTLDQLRESLSHSRNTDSKLDKNIEQENSSQSYQLDCDAVLEALNNCDQSLNDIAVNDLESPAMAQLPELTSLRSKLKSTDPFYVSMTGSGSCFYAIYQNVELRDQAHKKLHDQYPFVECAHIMNQSPFLLGSDS